MMNSLLVILLLITSMMVELSVQSSCYDGKGKAYCDKTKCKAVKCKGNVGKDMCDCCDVCLKQEGERCGGEYWHLGRCDHHVPHCIKLNKDSKVRQCATLKKATELGLLLKERTKCEKKKSKLSRGPSIECFFKMTGPTYWCKKIPMFNNDDCCVHTNQCNPNKKMYEKVETDLDLGTLGSTYRDQKRRQIYVSKRLAAASLKLLRMEMRKVKSQLRTVR